MPQRIVLSQIEIFILPLLFVIFIFYPGVVDSALVTKNFNWHTTETDHFVVYYYPECESALPLLLKYLEKAYKEVSAKLMVKIEEKIPVLFFISKNDFLQNNVVDVGEGTGGVTEAFKNRVLIPWTGSEKVLEHVVYHEFTHVCEFMILYSGFFKSIQLLKSIFYSLWLMEGAAEYFGAFRDRTLGEMYVRDAVVNNKLIPLSKLQQFTHLRPHQVVLAYKEAESAIRFFAEEYGEEKINLLFKEFKNRFEVISVLRNVCGADFNVFERKWKEYLEDKYYDIGKYMDTPDVYGRQVTLPINKNISEFNTDPVVNPKDEYVIFFLSDRSGVWEIYSIDLRTNKCQPVVSKSMRKYFDSINQDMYGRSFDVDPTGRYICFSARKNNKDFIFIYDIVRRRLEKKVLPGSYDFQAILDTSFYVSHRKIIFTGMRNGRNDIYLYDMEKGAVWPITDDMNDDRGARSSHDGKYIVFSKEEDKEYNIYLYRVEERRFERLTNMVGDELTPVFSNVSGKEILFISDSDGVYNMYSMDIEDRKPRQLTSTVGGVFTPYVLNSSSKLLVFSAYYNNSQHVYLSKSLDMLLAEGVEIEMEGKQSTATVNVDEVGRVHLSSTSFLEDRTLSFPIQPRPYKFSFSTDLFIPFIAYTSSEGLLLYTYWQGSEMLGNHRIAAEISVRESIGYFNYNLEYSYLRWRPKFKFASGGEQYYKYDDSINDIVLHRKIGIYGGCSYPLDEYSAVVLENALINEEEKSISLPHKFSDYKDIFAISYEWNTITDKYIYVALSGMQGILSYNIAYDFTKSNFAWEKYIFGLQHFIPIFYSHNLNYRVIVMRGNGITFSGKIRGYEWESYIDKISKKYLSNFYVEYKIPLFTGLDYYMWYILPDFYFKYLGVVLFYENLALFDTYEDLYLMQNCGIGVQFVGFIFQMYPFSMGVDVVKRIDSPLLKGYFVFNLSW
jgi:hypothetical protein